VRSLAGSAARLMLHSIGFSLVLPLLLVREPVSRPIRRSPLDRRSSHLVEPR
jgi:hypothetical protein